MMKIIVDIDVANFQARAYYTPEKKIVFPTDEVGRVITFETMDVEKFNQELKTRKNIFSILSKKEQRKIEKIADPLGMSGMRGSIEVEIDKIRLVELMKNG